MVVPSWMDRSALLWDPTLLAEVQPPCIYWEPQEWHSHSHSHSHTATTATSHDTAATPSCVSYRGLLTTAAVVVRHLRRDLEKHLVDIDKISSTGIPVVVSIPEGPWLPLAVLVVHALNRPFGTTTSTTSTGSSHAILVPLEPSEAMERNRRILQDIQPRLLLCVARDEPDPSQDIERLTALVDSVVTDNGDALSNSCQVLNFAKYVTEALTGQEISSFSFLDDFASSMEGAAAAAASSWTIQDWVAEAANVLTLTGAKSTGDAKANTPRISHIVYTSGTTGRPKGCVSSIQSLTQYLQVKNKVHDIQSTSTVLLASALSFDPCLSDVLATFQARAALALAPRSRLVDRLPTILQRLSVTHVLCTPTLWGVVNVAPASLPALQVVALGGEPIPNLIQRRWARTDADDRGCRLLATYGVTEACVYQTAGEIMSGDESTAGTMGQYVGKAFRGMNVRICQEGNQTSLLNVDPGDIGEVVLSGAQLDVFTGYWKRPELAFKFVAEENENGVVQYHYRTGDRGMLDSTHGTLRILGRIGAEEGMIKINGVRIELSEIEAAVVDDYDTSRSAALSAPSVVVESCMVKVLQGRDESSTRSEVHAYCVMSEKALSELELPSKNHIPKSGLLVSGGILLTLLRARCTRSLNAACVPNAFILLPNLPLSPTGKRDRRSLPPLSGCTPIERDGEQPTPLRDYSPLGKCLAEILSESLNLQKLQQEMLTTAVTLDMLGGDSLAATRVVRAIYAWHHQVDNTRYLGGEYGKFDGLFDVVHLLRAKNLGEYVDMLERHGVGTHDSMRIAANTEGPADENDNIETRAKEKPRSALYDALVQAITQGKSTIAIALLYAGADPNYGDHGSRLGKVSGGFYHRKFAFHSSPLHLACKQGDDRLVQHLLARGAKYKSPDAGGLYPLHLAASSMDGLPDEEGRRLRCVQYLLDAGALLVMKDGNQQTVLHAAARSGHSSVLRHAMMTWKQTGTEKLKRAWDQPYIDWMDRWYRTPVHWAILNGRIEALRTVLELGCNPAPFKPKASKKTSAAMEYPMELCDRLYPRDGSDEQKREMGNAIRELLQEAISKPLIADARIQS